MALSSMLTSFYEPVTAVSVVFVKELTDSYKCTMCAKFLDTPVQNTECGHRFCPSCAEEITNGSKICISCGEPMIKEMVFPDRAAIREIGNLEAYCTFHQHGCEEILLFKNLKSHSENCTFKPTETNSVGSWNPAVIQDLERRVDKLEKDVQNVDKKLDGLNKQVGELVVWKSSVTLNSTADTGSIRQIAEFGRRLQTVEEQVSAGSFIHGSISFDANALETRLSGLTASLQDVFARVDLHESTTYDGLLIWKIDNYKQKKKEAADGVRRSVYSSPFYSSRFGYKMCARAYLNGDGIGRGDYLSLFFVLMKGEYDAVLDFPFPLRVKFTLQDQDTHTRNLSDSFDPDPKSSSFQRPTSALNVGAGCPKFVRHSIVETPTYLKDDCIYLRIAVGKD